MATPPTCLVPERTVRTKDGREALVRSVLPGDGAAMVRHYFAIHRAGEGVVRSLAQVKHEPQAVEREIERWTTGSHSGPWGYWACALVAGELAGEARISREPFHRIVSNARLSIAVSPGFQELGLGRALMEALLDWARATARPDVQRRAADPGQPPVPAVRRVTLDVFADNARARGLYASLGFVEEGRRIAHIRRDDDTFDDDILMALRI